MQNLETRLFIFQDDDNVFTDHTISAQDYSRDEFDLVLAATDDYLYIGYNKPINAVYIELNTANTNANTFTLEYYNGTTWAAISPFSDETKGLTRSGFINWERNLTDDTAVEVNSQEAFWYRLQASSNHSAGTKVQGVNNVFSDDQDLISEVSNIVSRFLPSSASSHIMSHVAARDKIIQDLRNNGHVKFNPNSGRYQDINLFDILQIVQLREASKWRALAVIFDELSDVPEDKYDQRARKYNGRYKAAMNNLTFLNIDSDDDGKQDGFEEQASATAVLFRR